MPPQYPAGQDFTLVPPLLPGKLRLTSQECYLLTYRDTSEPLLLINEVAGHPDALQTHGQAFHRRLGDGSGRMQSDPEILDVKRDPAPIRVNVFPLQPPAVAVWRFDLTEPLGVVD
jgi:hypothetical protein